jgi:basic membrane protein A
VSKHVSRLRLVRPLGVVILAGLLVAACGGGGSAGSGSTSTAAEPFKVAMVLSGPINDGGWNAAHYQGLQAVEKDLGAEVAYTDNAQRPDFESILRNYGRQGYDLVIGNGAEYSDPIMAVAKEFPDTKFVAIFGYAQGGNVASYVPKGNEIGYLQGVVAGQLTTSNVIGWVGGIEIPSLKEMLAGVEDGVRAVNPAAKVVTTYTGNFIDVAAGREAGLSLISQGADVLLAVADGGNVGVTQAAKEKGVKFVGWPLEMQALAPDSVAVSVLFDIPKMVGGIATAVKDNTFKPEIIRLGVSDGILSYGQFSPWVPAEVRAKAEQTFEGIKSGSLKIPDHLDVYSS